MFPRRSEFKYGFLILLVILESKDYLIIISRKAGKRSVVSDVEATPKCSSDCLLDRKQGPSDDAQRRVIDARSAVGKLKWEWGRASMSWEEHIRTSSKRALLSATQHVWTWLWEKLIFKTSLLSFI